jgi:thiamine-phosphate pyrophosphorylase
MSLVFPPLYAILDAGLLKASEIAVAKDLADSGVELLQYRNKHATARELFEISSALSKNLSSFDRRGPRFIVNDRPDVALLAGAGGVHVGQQDLSVEDARALVGPDRWVGVSTHTLEQLAEADSTSAEYVAFGPIFATTTKAQHDPVVGIAGLAAARARTRKPLVAIGGITLENAAEIYTAGADSLAVARDILAAENPGARARAYLDVAARVLSKRAAGSPKV